MTMCVAEVAATGVDLRSIEALTAIGERFLHWYRMESPGIGPTTRAVLTAATTGADMPAAAAAHHARTRRAASNGALMRTAPVALAHLGDDDALVEAAIAVASLTHADPLAGQSCAIWCIAIDRAIREDRLDGAWDGLEKLPTPARREWKRNLDEAVRQPPSAFPKNWSAVGCLQAAYAAVLQTNGTVERRLQAAVHAGGDTDTVATVAGALLGARWGTEAIPSRWRSRLGDRWGHTADDIVRLAEAIAETRYKRLFA